MTDGSQKLSRPPSSTNKRIRIMSTKLMKMVVELHKMSKIISRLKKTWDILNKYDLCNDQWPENRHIPPQL